MEVDRISRFFVGKKILITGGTGFLGKVFVEKLLRLCPDIGEIMLLMRSKHGRDPKDRLEDILKNPLFGPLLATRKLEDVMSKLTAVSGDVKEKQLGLSKEDRDICRNAEIIIHSAATVRFDEGIKSAVLMNTRGTKYMLELAKECPNLQLMVHVSTAYCHPEMKVLEDKLYPPPADPHEIIAMVENMDDEVCDVMTEKLIGNYPNTYAYSKSLSEALVEEYMKTIPVVIARPSIVIPTYGGPIIGWTDNINGPVGLLIGAGKGVIRTMYGDDSYKADLVPVDVVVNVVCAMIWDFLENGYPHKVMNIALSDEINLTWKEILDLGKGTVENKIAFDNTLWCPGGYMTTSRPLHQIRAFFYHWIPALLIDALLFCLGYKPVLIRVHTRISKSFDVLEYYTNNNWLFQVDEFRKMRLKLNKLERKEYVMDADDLVLEEYFEQLIMSARRFLMKEKDENVPKARRNLKILKALDRTINVLFYILVIYFFINYSFKVLSLLL